MPDRGASVAVLGHESVRGRPASARTFASLRNDIAGGATAALLTIPSSMGYGVLALQSLGEPYLSHAVLAGLYCAIVMPLAVLALGGRTATMYAPRSVVALLVGSIVLQTLVSSPAAKAGQLTAETMFAIVLLLAVTAGLFQALFGALRLGALIKYIPSPVMAGFQNAVAILILVSQIDALLGVPRHLPLSRLAGGRPLPLGRGRADGHRHGQLRRDLGLGARRLGLPRGLRRGLRLLRGRTGVPEIGLEAVDLVHEHQDRLARRAQFIACAGGESRPPRSQGLETLLVEPLDHAGDPIPRSPPAKPPEGSAYPAARSGPGRERWLAAVPLESGP